MSKPNFSYSYDTSQYMNFKDFEFGFVTDHQVSFNSPTGGTIYYDRKTKQKIAESEFRKNAKIKFKLRADRKLPNGVYDISQATFHPVILPNAVFVSVKGYKKVKEEIQVVETDDGWSVRSQIKCYGYLRKTLYPYLQLDDLKKMIRECQGLCDMSQLNDLQKEMEAQKNQEDNKKKRAREILESFPIEKYEQTEVPCYVKRYFSGQYGSREYGGLASGKVEKLDFLQFADGALYVPGADGVKEVLSKEFSQFRNCKIVQNENVEKMLWGFLITVDERDNVFLTTSSGGFGIDRKWYITGPDMSKNHSPIRTGETTFVFPTKEMFHDEVCSAQVVEQFSQEQGSTIEETGKV